MIALAVALVAGPLPAAVAEGKRATEISIQGESFRIVSRGETGGQFRGMRGPVCARGSRGETGAMWQAIPAMVGRVTAG